MNGTAGRQGTNPLKLTCHRHPPKAFGVHTNRTRRGGPGLTITAVLSVAMVPLMAGMLPSWTPAAADGLGGWWGFFLPNRGLHLIHEFGGQIRIPMCRAGMFATLAQHIIHGFASRDEIAIYADIPAINNLHCKHLWV